MVTLQCTYEYWILRILRVLISSITFTLEYICPKIYTKCFPSAVSHEPSSAWLRSIHFPLHYTMFFWYMAQSTRIEKYIFFLPKVYDPFVFSYTQRSCLVDIVQQPRPERNELLECFATNKRRICRTLNTSLTKNSMFDSVLFSFWKAATENWMFCVQNISMRTPNSNG